MNLRSVVCLVLVVVLAFGIIVFPFTVSASVSEVNSYWDWIQLSPIGQWSYILDHAYNALQDKLHPECDHNWVAAGRGEGFSTYRCSKCGETMQIDRSGFGSAYNDYVNNLPATGYTSAGHLIWQPTVDDIYNVYVKYSTSVNGSDRKIPYSYDSSSESVRLTINSSGDGIFYSESYTSPYSYSKSWGISLCPKYTIPCPGMYRVLASRKGHSKAILRDSILEKDFFYAVGEYFSSHSEDPEHIMLDYSDYFDILDASSSVYGFEIELFCPVFEVIPDTGFGSIYNINTRASTITGDVYYYDVNGDLKTYNNCLIVNETNNTYYNPVTQQTHPFGDWTYDYMDRSYTCNCDDGTTTTITFSDDCIIIKEGENTYYVYYSVQDTGTPEPTPSPDVTPTPTPTPTPGPVDPDGPDDPGDDDHHGLLTWLKEFKVWLGEKLDALIGGGGDVDVDVDIDLSYTDEDGNEKKTSVKGIIRSFNWWKQVAGIGREMISQVSAAEVAAYAYDANAPGSNPTGAPSIPVNLSAAQSYYGAVYGEDMELLDLSWYTPYKKTVDDLISGFLWLFFLWALFRHAPAVISGAGLTSERAEAISWYRKAGKG